jgi:pilus assembly protein Flp/PilA
VDLLERVEDHVEVVGRERRLLIDIVVGPEPRRESVEVVERFAQAVSCCIFSHHSSLAWGPAAATFCSYSTGTRCHMRNLLISVVRNHKAATAIEYGLIAALIAVAAIAAMQGLGNKLKTTFNNVSTNMKAS